MSDDFDIEFYPDRGSLELNCEGDAFVRLRDLVIKEFDRENKLAISADEIKNISLYGKSGNEPEKRSVRDFASQFGCAAILIALVLVFGAGVAHIISWFRK